MSTMELEVVRHAGEDDLPWADAGGGIEPAGSVHTLTVPADNTEPTDVLFIIEGVNLNLTPDGQVESVTMGPERWRPTAISARRRATAGRPGCCPERRKRRNLGARLRAR